MLQVYKIDNDYIVLREDAQIPAVRERTYSRSPAQALRGMRDDIEYGGHSVKGIKIMANEFADKAMIEKYGFTAA